MGKTSKGKVGGTLVTILNNKIEEQKKANFVSEIELKESVEEYLKDNPFKKDYTSQKAAYEKLVERIFKLEKHFFHHSHD